MYELQCGTRTLDLDRVTMNPVTRSPVSCIVRKQTDIQTLFFVSAASNNGWLDLLGKSQKYFLISNKSMKTRPKKRTFAPMWGDEKL